MNEKLFNVDYLKHLCDKFGLRPSKKYGQNFLINPEVVDNIVEAAGLKKTDTVVEVGPGFGALTFALCAAAKQVVAFEIEKKLQPYWDTFCHSRENGNPDIIYNKIITNLQIVWGNILKIFNIKILKYYNIKDYKVIANLPYQITSAVIQIFLESENPPSEMVLMVQKEVAQRICATAGDTSLLSLAVQYFAQPQIIINVLKNNFWPEPQVDSAIIKLTPYTNLARSAEETEYFFKVARAGFAQKRKLLIKNLLPIVGKQHREEIARILAKIGLSATARAQELSLEQWLKLAEEIKKQS